MAIKMMKTINLNSNLGGKMFGSKRMERIEDILDDIREKMKTTDSLILRHLATQNKKVSDIHDYIFEVEEEKAAAKTTQPKRKKAKK